MRNCVIDLLILVNYCFSDQLFFQLSNLCFFLDSANVNASLESSCLEDGTTDNSMLMECDRNYINPQRIQTLTITPNGTSCVPVMSHISPRGRSITNIGMAEPHIGTSGFVQVSQASPVMKRNDTDIRSSDANIRPTLLSEMSHFGIDVRKNDLPINQDDGPESIIGSSNLSTSTSNRQLTTRISSIESRVSSEQLRQGCVPEENQPLFETSNNSNLSVLSPSPAAHLNSIPH